MYYTVSVEAINLYRMIWWLIRAGRTPPSVFNSTCVRSSSVCIARDILTQNSQKCKTKIMTNFTILCVLKRSPLVSPKSEAGINFTPWLGFLPLACFISFQLIVNKPLNPRCCSIETNISNIFKTHAKMNSLKCSFCFSCVFYVSLYPRDRMSEYIFTAV